MLKKKPEIVFRTLVENMNEAVWMWDKNKETIYANPRFCDILWYSLKEIIWKKSCIFWSNKNIKEVKEIKINNNQKWISTSYEWYLIRKDNKKIPILFSWALLPNGWSIWIMTNLTKLKEKENKEKNSKEQILLNAVMFSTDAIILIWTDLKIKSWNKWSKILFWYKEKYILWKEITNIFYKKDIEILLKDSSIIYKYEIIWRHKNKSKLNFSVTITPIYDEKMVNINSYLLVCRDITNHRKIEKEIELKYQKIREVYNMIWKIKREKDYIFDLIDMFNNYYHDIYSIWDFIVTSIIMLTKVDASVLRTYNKKEKTLEMVSNFWLSDDWQWKKVLKLKNSLLERALYQESPLKILDLTKESKYKTQSLAKRNNLSSLLLIPLKLKGEIIWSLSLYTKPDKKLEIFENEFIIKYSRVIELVMASILKI